MHKFCHTVRDQKALAVKPDYAEAHSNLAIVLNSEGRRSEALEHFKTSLELERGGHPIDPRHESFRFIKKPKMNHDIEQFRYLASLGHEAGRFQSLVKVYEAVAEEIDWPGDDGVTIPLSDDHRHRLGDTYNRSIHLLGNQRADSFRRRCSAIRDRRYGTEIDCRRRS